MFSGIIETPVQLLQIQKLADVCKIQVQKPAYFDDIKLGDSVAVNGVCLTVEEFTTDFLQFTLGEETLKITGWREQMPTTLNLERSLRLSDRIHGHLVTGHVDAVGKVVHLDTKTETLEIHIQMPREFLKYVWKKGSLCLNGVSLTINDIQDDVLSFYLIPETLKKTNFSNVRLNDSINLEFDVMAKILLRQKELS